MDFKKTIQLNKIANILIYMAENTEDCGVTKANKLLYYVDCFHLLECGRIVTNDEYKKLPQGPVPEETYTRLTALVELSQGIDINIGFKQNYKEFLQDYIEIKIEELPEPYNCRYKLIAKKNFDPQWFSKSEIRIIKKVANKYKKMSARKMSEITHDELPYKKALSSGSIDLKYYVKKKVTKEQFEEIKYIENLEKAMLLNY